MNDKNLFEEFVDDPGVARYVARLEEGELEILALLGEKDERGAVSLGTAWAALQNIIAHRRLPAGELVRGPGFLTWPVREHTQRGLGDSFASYGLVRARVRAEKLNMRGDSRFAVLELLPAGDLPADVVADVEEIAAEYVRPVEVTRPAGTLTYQRRLSVLEGTVPWAGRETYAYVDVEADEGVVKEAQDLEREVGPALDLLDRIVRDADAIDRRLRTFAAQEMLEEANQWRQDDEETNGDRLPEITVDSFAERIWLESVSVPVDADENLEFTYDDDSMFGGHGVGVTADRDGAPLAAEIS